MVGDDRLSNAYDLVREVVRQKIPGDIVECGVFNGGCSAMMAAALCADDCRNVWMFDSFEGLPHPREEDGDKARTYSHLEILNGNLEPINRCVGAEQNVREIFSLINFPIDKMRICKGWFQDVLPKRSGETPPIAVLRLDGDWYESTMICLEYLYPKLSIGGYLIIDDYGYWEGCKRAVDEYFSKRNFLPEINIIDDTGVFIKKGLQDVESVI